MTDNGHDEHPFDLVASVDCTFWGGTFCYRHLRLQKTPNAFVTSCTSSSVRSCRATAIAGQVSLSVGGAAMTRRGATRTCLSPRASSRGAVWWSTRAMAGAGRDRRNGEPRRWSGQLCRVGRAEVGKTRGGRRRVAAWKGCGARRGRPHLLVSFVLLLARPPRALLNAFVFLRRARLSCPPCSRPLPRGFGGGASGAAAPKAAAGGGVGSGGGGGGRGWAGLATGGRAATAVGWWNFARVARAATAGGCGAAGAAGTAAARVGGGPHAAASRRRAAWAKPPLEGAPGRSGTRARQRT